MKLSLVATLLAMTLLTSLLWPAATADEGKKAWLRMEIVSTNAPNVYYMGDNPDDLWLEDSWIVETESGWGTFTATINVTNIHSTGSVHDITLVLATTNTTVVLITVESPLFNTLPINRTSTGIVDMRTDGDDYIANMPGHGVYNSAPPPTWYEYRAPPNNPPNYGPILSPGGFVLFRVNFTLTNAPNDWKLHADAYGWTEESGKKVGVVNGDKVDAAFIPFSKDITFTVPEFEVAAYLVASSAAVILLFRKRLTSIKPNVGLN